MVVLVLKFCIPELHFNILLLYLYSTLLGEKLLFLFTTDYLGIRSVNFYILCFSSTLELNCLVVILKPVLINELHLLECDAFNYIYSLLNLGIALASVKMKA